MGYVKALQSIFTLLMRFSFFAAWKLPGLHRGLQFIPSDSGNKAFAAGIAL